MKIDDEEERNKSDGNLITFFCENQYNRIMFPILLLYY